MRNCWCGLPLDLRGHHLAACAGAGVLGERGYTLESVTARIWREAVRDLEGADGRRLEVVVDGLRLFGGSQLVVDATLVSALHANGPARRGAVQEDGAALTIARWRKERRYPELVGPGGRASLVVFGLEVGGRWSDETQISIRLLARARARSEGHLMRRRAEHAWCLRWELAFVVHSSPCSRAFSVGVAWGLRSRRQLSSVTRLGAGVFVRGFGPVTS